MSDVHSDASASSDGSEGAHSNFAPVEPEGVQEARVPPPIRPHVPSPPSTDLSTPEKVALADFERGIIADDDSLVMYGVCIVCNEMASCQHARMARHNENVRLYNFTLSELLRVSSSRKGVRRDPRSCIVQYLEDNLMPPVTNRWWKRAAQYVMGDVALTSLLSQNVEQEDSTSSAAPDQSLRCVVCMNTVRRIMFSPCRHVLCCATCSNHVTRCPVCRSGIEERTVVFLS